MLKTISQIARMCYSNYESVNRATLRLKIYPAQKKGQIKRFNEFQIELIIDHLFYLGKIDSLIYESRMNDPDFGFEPYSREEMYEKGYLVCKS